MNTRISIKFQKIITCLKLDFRCKKFVIHFTNLWINYIRVCQLVSTDCRPHGNMDNFLTTSQFIYIEYLVALGYHRGLACALRYKVPYEVLSVA